MGQFDRVPGIILRRVWEVHRISLLRPVLDRTLVWIEILLSLPMMKTILSPKNPADVQLIAEAPY